MWELVDRPGYFGEKRDEIQAGFDQTYGKGKWRIAWQWGGRIIERPEALQLYEDGYYEYFKINTQLFEWLTQNYADVYDTAPSNVMAGFSYDIQETPNNHIHDVAIRRAVMRRGIEFKGQELLQVRSDQEESFRLSPCMIPFHLPDMIYRGETKYKGEARDFSKKPPWWKTKGVPDNVEMFYQQNKVLQVKV